MKTPAAKSAKRDDGLDWLREIRRRLSIECHHDPFEMGRRLREREQDYKGRIFTTKRVLVPADDVADS